PCNGHASGTRTRHDRDAAPARSPSSRAPVHHGSVATEPGGQLVPGPLREARRVHYLIRAGQVALAVVVDRDVLQAAVAGELVRCGVDAGGDVQADGAHDVGRHLV